MKDIPLQCTRTGYQLGRVLKLYEIKRSTWYSWQGQSGESSGSRFNNRSLLPEEVESIVNFRKEHREVGYRKLTWMLNDADAAYVSESAVYQVLSWYRLLGRWDRAENGSVSKEYRDKPCRVHEHWHTDLAYVKVKGVYYFLIMLLDGYSRFLLHWDLLTDMTSGSVELFIQEARERYPFASPKLIHDNGAAFISRDFKQLVTRLGIQQVFTRRNHPQTNGKIERLNGLVRQEALRENYPTSYQEAWQTIHEYVAEYNYQRLHSAIHFLRPADVFFGREHSVLKLRKQKLEQARAHRIAANIQNKDLSIGRRRAEPSPAQAPRRPVGKSAGWPADHPVFINDNPGITPYRNQTVCPI